jgi:hypothetical protein
MSARVKRPNHRARGMDPQVSRLIGYAVGQPEMFLLGGDVHDRLVEDAERARSVSDLSEESKSVLRRMRLWPLTDNIFCPTGPGGGIKPDCKAGAGGTLTLSGTEMKMPTTAKEAAMVRLVYQRERPEVRHQILDSLGIGADKSKPPPPIEQVHKTLQAEMARRANPGSIRDELKNSPHDATRKKVEALNERLEGLEGKYATLNSQLVTATRKEDKDRIEGEQAQIRKDLGALNREALALIKDGLKGGAPITEKDIKNVPGVPADGGLNKPIDTVRQFLDGIVKTADGKAPPPVACEYGAGGRAQYEAGSQVIFTKLGGGPVAVVHEYGHHLEYRVPGVKEAAQKFLQERVGDEPFVKLREKFPESMLRENETGRKDDFDRAFGTAVGEMPHRPYYVGKVYADGATEVVSMGLEKLYADPIKFAKNDPEFFNFTMGMLGGEHRGKTGG